MLEAVCDKTYATVLKKELTYYVSGVPTYRFYVTTFTDFQRIMNIIVKSAFRMKNTNQMQPII